MIVSYPPGSHKVYNWQWFRKQLALYFLSVYNFQFQPRASNLISMVIEAARVQRKAKAKYSHTLIMVSLDCAIYTNTPTRYSHLTMNIEYGIMHGLSLGISLGPQLGRA